MSIKYFNFCVTGIDWFALNPVTENTEKSLRIEELRVSCVPPSVSSFDWLSLVRETLYTTSLNKRYILTQLP